MLLKVITATVKKRELLGAYSSLAVTLKVLNSKNIATKLKLTCSKA